MVVRLVVRLVVVAPWGKPMSEPSFLSEGTTPRLTDTKQRVLTKWLGVLQNRAGALASNNPRPDDTIYKLKQKIDKALTGTP